MQTIQIDPAHPTAEAIARVARALKDRGAVAVPTDTSYGLAVNALDEQAIKLVFAIKNRPRAAALSIVVRDFAMAKRYAWFGKISEAIFHSFLPGPLTLVTLRRDTVPAALTAYRPAIGIRVIPLPFYSALFQSIDFPVTITSANVAGNPDCYTPAELTKEFSGRTPAPNLIVDGGALAHRAPSTVVDATRPNPKILREGPITLEAILKAIA